jgi:hypothetical protein
VAVADHQPRDLAFAQPGREPLAQGLKPFLCLGWVGLGKEVVGLVCEGHWMLEQQGHATDGGRQACLAKLFGQEPLDAVAVSAGL